MQRSFQILRMHDRCDHVFCLIVLQGEPGIVEGTAIRMETAPVRREDDDVLRHAIHELRSSASACCSSAYRVAFSREMAACEASSCSTAIRAG